MGKSTCCEKVGLKKGPWTPEEDKKLLAYIQEHGHGNWRALPEKAGLQRCGKSCRLRWTNYLRPDIKRGKFSLQEEQTIIQLHALLGNRWSAIAAHLPRRTDNEIKNHWNTHIKKRLNKMGIDPVTHKPKAHAFGSTKDAANLSHMAQWESARLEAEARLVRESKCVVPNSNILQNHQVMGSALPQLSGTNGSTKIPRPSAASLYYLDVLKALQGAAKPTMRAATNEAYSTTTLLSAFAFASDDLESPTSIFNFPPSTAGTTKPVITYQENGRNGFSSLQKQTQILELEENLDSAVPNLEDLTYPTDCTWFNDTSFALENEDACIPNTFMQGYNDIFTNNALLTVAENFDNMACGNNDSNFDQEMKSYCSSMVNLVNASSYGSPLF